MRRRRLQTNPVVAVVACGCTATLVLGASRPQISQLHGGETLAPRRVTIVASPPATRPAQPLERVVFVLDGLGRLSDDDRQRVLTQVKAAVAAMKPQQTFNVVLTRDQGEITFKPNRLISATVTNYKQLRDWLLIPAGVGGTDIRPGLDVAFALDPEAIYLITDGQPTGGAAALAKLADETAQRFATKKSRVALHTVLISPSGAPAAETGAGEALQRLAAASGGTFVSVTVATFKPGSGLPESKKD